MSLQLARALLQPSLLHLQEQVRDAATKQTQILITGGGSKPWYREVSKSPALPTIELSMRDHTGIVSYQPNELVITACAGTPLAEIQAALEEHGQYLPFEPPQLANSTIGGVVATALAGAARPYSGGLRDYVLGAQLLDGRGQILSFGGEVMKNVAGYDVSRLLAGSLGYLGAITRVSLKVMPKPVSVVTLQWQTPRQQAITEMNHAVSSGLPVSATAWHSGVAYIRLSGSQVAVARAVQNLKQAIPAIKSFAHENVSENAFWRSLGNWTHSFFSRLNSVDKDLHQSPIDRLLWRVSVPPLANFQQFNYVAAVGINEDEGLIEWGGAQRWLWQDVTAIGNKEDTFNEAAGDIRRLALAAGGHATVFDLYGKVPARIPRFTPLAGEILAIHRRLKSEFDPHRLFNRGVLLADD